MLIYFWDYQRAHKNIITKFFIADIFQFLKKSSFDKAYNVYVDVCLSLLICAYLEKKFSKELINDKHFIEDVLNTIRSDTSNYSTKYPTEKETFINFVSNLQKSDNPFLEYCDSEFVRECVYHIVMENIVSSKSETYIGYLFKIIPLTKIYGTNCDNKWFTSLIDDLVGFDPSLIRIENSKKSYVFSDSIINQFLEKCQDDGKMECCFVSIRISDTDDRYFHYFSFVKYRGKWILNNEFLAEDYLLFRRYRNLETLFRECISFYTNEKRNDRIDNIRLESVIFAKDYTSRTKNFEKYCFNESTNFKTNFYQQIKKVQAKRKIV
jgi:hypothetical protein